VRCGADRRLRREYFCKKQTGKGWLTFPRQSDRAVQGGAPLTVKEQSRPGAV